MNDRSIIFFPMTPGYRRTVALPLSTFGLAGRFRVGALDNKVFELTESFLSVQCGPIDSVLLEIRQKQARESESWTQSFNY